MTRELRCATAADTHALGERLAAVARPGDLILLSGPLGAGKTALARGIGAGLGVAGAVTSPTFVIARVHPGAPAMVHVDAYRLGDTPDPLGEIDALDLDASLDESVTVVEWGDGVAERLADAHLHVRIDRHPDDSRVITLAGHGGDWDRRVAAA
ncbi:tRNA (adenosine(37)-N6)-threonylcarbamoyltransferase complex ATPase subunit type 1 TsaE [Pilimelia anulata]|uniref:tRNA threonylcarbamoyladenosine biosynthesis protein TsaE n=1 Tax=Pilimelia anulata TaxID=53371 RepID=A0A8J3FAY3_9ACTN|nr:tRNA (adenosine(37)-N6)-threonylcarbamoyltransferase complex ATPase subunit type 1 TsaE [Pilimelia anulata]GGJ99102.1 tRNA (adenosine(37)-N6)-threonylcarbamoyltransferase complex ATPase subunit type 1 TsaE [Pilimelia anulata]